MVQTSIVKSPTRYEWKTFDMSNSRKRKDKGGKVAWPSVEQQLIDAKVTPGSALDRLIRENQDFGMLFPSEANDKLRLPLWLRVYWRKHHPEIDYLPNDPSGGYPLALRDLYNWMIRNHDLRGLQGVDTR